MENILSSENGIVISELTIKWANKYIAYFDVDYDSSPIPVPAENCKICEYFQYLYIKRKELVTKSHFDTLHYTQLTELGKILPINVFSVIFLAAKICEIHDCIFGDTCTMIHYFEPKHIFHHFLLSSCSEDNFIHNTLIENFNKILDLFRNELPDENSDHTNESVPLPRSHVSNLARNWGLVNKKQKCKGSGCAYTSFISPYPDNNIIHLLQKSPALEGITSEENSLLSSLLNLHQQNKLMDIDQPKNQKLFVENIIKDIAKLNKFNAIIIQQLSHHNNEKHTDFTGGS